MKKKKNNEQVELDISAIGFEGIAIGRIDNVVHFVKNAVPGDKILAQVLRKKKSFVEAHLLNIIEASPDRIEPRCSYFLDCGGCSWQNLGYEKQTEWKSIHVKDACERIGKLEVEEYKPILLSEQVFNYRNKMDFSFSSNRWLTKKEIEDENAEYRKDFAFGLHAPGRFDKVLDIKECHIQSEIGNEVINKVREKALEQGVSAWDSYKHSGFLRSLIIRTSLVFNQLMLILITNEVKNDTEQAFLDWFENEFAAQLPENSEIFHCINETQSPVRISSQRLIKGNGYITERILGIDYRISPFSFFQTNSYQLDKFIGAICEAANSDNSKVVWDLYCGTGSITLPMSKNARRVIGVELVASSISDAKENASRNNISNVDFFECDLHTKVLPELLHNLPQPDIIVCDPPRAGMHENVVRHILEVQAPRVVYVSCNPTTQARDLAILAEKYRIVSVQAVDMFPHTFHIESIAILELK